MCYCTDFALFYFVFEDNCKYKPPGAYIRGGGGRLNGRVFGVMSLGGGTYILEGLIGDEVVYFRNFMVSLEMGLFTPEPSFAGMFCHSC